MSPDELSPDWNPWRSRRNFNLFVVSLAGVGTLLIAGIIIHATGLIEHLQFTLPGFALWFLVLGRQAVRRARARARRRERLQRSPLSRDELRVARSKLVQYRKAKHL